MEITGAEFLILGLSVMLAVVVARGIAILVMYSKRSNVNEADIHADSAHAEAERKTRERYRNMTRSERFREGRKVIQANGGTPYTDDGDFLETLLWLDLITNGELDLTFTVEELRTDHDESIVEGLQDIYAPANHVELTLPAVEDDDSRKMSYDPEPSYDSGSSYDSGGDSGGFDD